MNKFDPSHWTFFCIVQLLVVFGSSVLDLSQVFWRRLEARHGDASMVSKHGFIYCDFSKAPSSEMDG